METFFLTLELEGALRRVGIEKEYNVQEILNHLLEIGEITYQEYEQTRCRILRTITK